MKVLFVAGACPYPPDSGGVVRTYNLLRRVCERNEITLIAPEKPGVDLDAAFGGHLRQVVTVPMPRRTLGHCLRSMASPLPYIVKAHQSADMAAVVEDALAAERFDLLHCDSISVVPSIPRGASIPKVFNAHNIEAVIWERYVREERRPWMMPMLKSQLAKVRAYEAFLPRIFDCCVTVSEHERDEMRRYGFKLSLTVRNGVDLDYYARLPQANEPKFTLISALDWRPNQDALRWFLGEIWPLIRSGISGAEMSVVGRRPPRWIARLCEANGVRLHADAPDVRPHLAEASVVVVPLRIGGGSRLKILEAMAAGRCVVSTSIGAEGLEVRHGEHLLIADTPAGFAEAALSLVGDARDHRALRQTGDARDHRALRDRLARAGRALVEAEYGWDRIAVDLEEAWRSCYDTHTAAGLQRRDGSAGAARQHS